MDCAAYDRDFDAMEGYGVCREKSWNAIRLCSAVALPATVGFAACVASAQPAEAPLRLAPDDYFALPAIRDRANSSGAQSMESRVLKGDPTRLGLYTILLTVPPHSRIAPHAHPDDRVGTVVFGTWYYGYGSKFDENGLKALPAGSYYTEPAGVPHFARTGEDGAVVQITGVGPTGTSYVDPARRRLDSNR